MVVDWRSNAVRTCSTVVVAAVAVAGSHLGIDLEGCRRPEAAGRDLH